jgi:hypothetical protein
MTHYTAFVTYRFRNEAGEFEEKTITNDVTDCVAEGDSFEELTDRIYWKQIHGTPGFFDIVAGGVYAD